MVRNWTMKMNRPGECAIFNTHINCLLSESKVFDSFPNPLALLNRQEVLEEVEEFIVEKELTSFRRLFKTAALVAHHPHEFENFNDILRTHHSELQGVRELEEEELEALRNESTKRFKHPRSLYWTIVLCSIGAAVQ